MRRLVRGHHDRHHDEHGPDVIMRVSKPLSPFLAHVRKRVPASAVSAIVAALDHREVDLDPDNVSVVALSLVEALAEIVDLRKARGIRHGVLVIALLGACGVLTGARSFAAIRE